VHGEARSVGMPCGLFNACMGRTDGSVDGSMDGRYSGRRVIRREEERKEAALKSVVYSCNCCVLNS
jgi:hypothetical protein